MGSPDWLLWFAYMENVPANFSIDMNLEQSALLALAVDHIGAQQGVLTAGEFVEMVLWEKLADPNWHREYDAIESIDGPHPCFFCGTPTTRIDIAFEAPYCGSGTCDWAVGEDLRMLETRAS